MLIPKKMRVYLYVPPTDMRKSIDGLCLLVSQVLQMNLLEGHLFLFRNKKGNKLKALYYEQNCFTLLYRRLDEGKFIFPKDADGHIELSREHFRWILSSDKFSRLSAMKPKEKVSFA